MKRKWKGKGKEMKGKGKEMKGNQKEIKRKGKGKKREREIESGFSTTKLGKGVLKAIERELIGKLGLGNHFI